MNPEIPAVAQPAQPSQPVAGPISYAHYESNTLKLILPALAAFRVGWVNYLWLILLSLIPIGLILWMLYAVLLGIIYGFVFSWTTLAIFSPLILIVIILSSFLHWGYIKVSINAVNGERIPFRRCLPGFRNTLKLIVTNTLTFLLIFVGSLLIVPGIIATALWSYSAYVTVTSGEWGWPALVKSREIMRGRSMDVLGAVFLVIALNSVVYIPFMSWAQYIISVFGIAMIPLMAVRYKALIDLKNHVTEEKLPVSPWNYLILAATILPIIYVLISARL